MGKLTKEKTIEIAKDSKTFTDFGWNLRESLPRNRQIRTAEIGEYVLIKSPTYGRKTPFEFNLGIPSEGEIVKFNPKSVVVEVGDGGKYKFPATALVSTDISILTEIGDLETFYQNAVGEEETEKEPFEIYATTKNKEESYALMDKLHDDGFVYDIGYARIRDATARITELSKQNVDVRVIKQLKERPRGVDMYLIWRKGDLVAGVGGAKEVELTTKKSYDTIYGDKRLWRHFHDKKTNERVGFYSIEIEPTEKISFDVRGFKIDEVLGGTERDIEKVGWENIKANIGKYFEPHTEYVFKFLERDYNEMKEHRGEIKKEVKEPWGMTYTEFFDIAGSEYGAGERFGVPTKNRVPINPETGYGMKGATPEARIHRAVLMKALKEGKPVPEEVLVEYPDLIETQETIWGKEPWEMTKSEYTTNKILFYENFLRETKEKPITEMYPESAKSADVFICEKNIEALRKGADTSYARPFRDHKHNIEQALREGKNVPDTVLEDYPEWLSEFWKIKEKTEKKKEAKQPKQKDINFKGEFILSTDNPELYKFLQESKKELSNTVFHRRGIIKGYILVNLDSLKNEGAITEAERKAGNHAIELIYDLISDAEQKKPKTITVKTTKPPKTPLTATEAEKLKQDIITEVLSETRIKKVHEPYMAMGVMWDNIDKVDNQRELIRIGDARWNTATSKYAGANYDKLVKLTKEAIKRYNERRTDTDTYKREQVWIDGYLKERWRCPICGRAAPGDFCIVHSDVDAVDILEDKRIREMVLEVAPQHGKRGLKEHVLEYLEVKHAKPFISEEWLAKQERQGKTFYHIKPQIDALIADYFEMDERVKEAEKVKKEEAKEITEKDKRRIIKAGEKIFIPREKEKIVGGAGWLSDLWWTSGGFSFEYEGRDYWRLCLERKDEEDVGYNAVVSREDNGFKGLIWKDAFTEGYDVNALAEAIKNMIEEEPKTTEERFEEKAKEQGYATAKDFFKEADKEIEKFKKAQQQPQARDKKTRKTTGLKTETVKKGDIITDGLVRGEVVGEGTIGKHIPAYKILILTGHEKGSISAIPKDQAKRVSGVIEREETTKREKVVSKKPIKEDLQQTILTALEHLQPDYGLDVPTAELVDYVARETGAGESEIRKTIGRMYGDDVLDALQGLGVSVRIAGKAQKEEQKIKHISERRRKQKKEKVVDVKIEKPKSAAEENMYSLFSELFTSNPELKEWGIAELYVETDVPIDDIKAFFTTRMPGSRETYAQFYKREFGIEYKLNVKKLFDG